MRDDDLIRLDAQAGTLEVLLDGVIRPARENEARPAALATVHAQDLGHEWFAGMRRNATSTEQGAVSWL